jgi:hypothetical protein
MKAIVDEAADEAGGVEHVVDPQAGVPLLGQRRLRSIKESRHLAFWLLTSHAHAVLDPRCRSSH